MDDARRPIRIQVALVRAEGEEVCLHGAACARVGEISTSLDIDLNSEVVRLRSATSLETEGRMSEAYKICDE